MGKILKNSYQIPQASYQRGIIQKSYDGSIKSPYGHDKNIYEIRGKSVVRESDETYKAVDVEGYSELEKIGQHYEVEGRAEVVKSKNLVNIPDKTNTTQGYYIGTASDYINSEKIKLSAGTYTFSFDWTGGGACELRFYTSSNEIILDEVINNLSAKRYNVTITLNKQADGIMHYFNNSTGGTISNIQIEEGSTATPYTPYFEPYIQGACEWRGNQLVQNDYALLNTAFTSVIDNSTLTHTTQGYTEIVGTNTELFQNRFWLLYNKIQFTKGHKYYIALQADTNLTFVKQIYDSKNFIASWYNKPFIYSCNTTINGYVSVFSGSNIQVDFPAGWYWKSRLYIVDLTDIYGQGNEPTTVEQFLSNHPEYNNYVEYAPLGTIRNQLMLSDGQIMPLNSPLYGLNEVKDIGRTNGLINRKYGVVDLGDLDWWYQQDGTRFQSNNVADIKPLAILDAKPNIVCAKYKTETPLRTWNIVDNCISISGGGAVIVRDTRFTSASEFKQAMQGVKLVYELANYTIEQQTPLENLPASISVIGEQFTEVEDKEIRNGGYKNLWDEEWEVGSINLVNGTKYSITGAIRSKNYIEVQPNTSYYFYSSGFSYGKIAYYDKDKNYISGLDWTSVTFNKTHTTPSNCYFIRFSTSGQYGATYNHDIAIYEGSTPHTYVPYGNYYVNIDNTPIKVGTEPLRRQDIVRTDLGTVRKRARVDLGSLDYTYGSGYYGGAPHFISTNLSNCKPSESSSSIPNLICSKYGTLTINGIYVGRKGISYSTSSTNQLMILDSDYTDPVAFKNSLQGIYLEYELTDDVLEPLDSITYLTSTYNATDYNKDLALTNERDVPVTVDIESIGTEQNGQYYVQIDKEDGSELSNYCIGSRQLKEANNIYDSIKGDNLTQKVESMTLIGDEVWLEDDSGIYTTIPDLKQDTINILVAHQSALPLVVNTRLYLNIADITSPALMKSYLSTHNIEINYEMDNPIISKIKPLR